MVWAVNTETKTKALLHMDVLRKKDERLKIWQGRNRRHVSKIQLTNLWNIPPGDHEGNLHL